MIFTLPIPPLRDLKPESPESLHMRGVCDRCGNDSTMVESGPAGSEVRRPAACTVCDNEWTMTIKRGIDT